MALRFRPRFGPFVWVPGRGVITGTIVFVFKALWVFGVVWPCSFIVWAVLSIVYLTKWTVFLIRLGIYRWHHPAPIGPTAPRD